jgi:signal transduction histidine kinase
MYVPFESKQLRNAQCVVSGVRACVQQHAVIATRTCTKTAILSHLLTVPAFALCLFLLARTGYHTVAHVRQHKMQLKRQRFSAQDSAQQVAQVAEEPDPSNVASSTPAVFG